MLAPGKTESVPAVVRISTLASLCVLTEKDGAQRRAATGFLSAGACLSIVLKLIVVCSRGKKGWQSESGRLHLYTEITSDHAA